MAYENIIVETRARVGLIRLNRPKALNALNAALMCDLGEALMKFDADEAIEEAGPYPSPDERPAGSETRAIAGPAHIGKRREPRRGKGIAHLEAANPKGRSGLRAARVPAQ